MEKRFLGHLLRLAASFPLHPENTPTGPRSLCSKSPSATARRQVAPGFVQAIFRLIAGVPTKYAPRAA